jgi:DnaJ domain
VFHPDHNNSPEATVRFQQISEAYACLSDPTKRVRYDNTLNTGSQLVFYIPELAPNGNENSLVVSNACNLLAAIKRANLPGSEILAWGKRDIEIAEVMLADPELCEKLSTGIVELAITHESIAIDILNDPLLWQKFAYLTPSILSLARAHFSACELILANRGITQHLTGEDLAKIATYHQGSATLLINANWLLAERWQAYKNLQTYLNEELPALDETINRWLHQSKSNSYQLKNMAIQKIAVANIILADPVLCKLCSWGPDIANIAIAHEEIAILILNDPLLWQKFANVTFYVVLLAKTHFRACELILKNSGITQYLSGKDLFELTVVHGLAVASLINQDSNLSKMLEDYVLLNSAKSCSNLEIKKTDSAPRRIDHSQSLYTMGFMFEKERGNGTATVAADYYQQAAAEGHGPAFQRLIELIKTDRNPVFEYAIANIYTDLDNPLWNKDEAVKWYRKAARQNHLPAIDKLFDFIKERIAEQKNININEDSDILILLSLSESSAIDQTYRDRSNGLLATWYFELCQFSLSLNHIRKVENLEASDILILSSLSESSAIDQEDRDKLHRLLARCYLESYQNSLSLEHMLKIQNLKGKDFYRISNLQLNVTTEEQSSSLSAEDQDQKLREHQLMEERSNKVLFYSLQGALRNDALCSRLSIRLLLDCRNYNLKLTESVLELAVENVQLWPEMSEIIPFLWELSRTMNKLTIVNKLLEIPVVKTYQCKFLRDQINAFAIFPHKNYQLKTKLKSFADILIETVNEQEEQSNKQENNSEVQVKIAKNLANFEQIIDDAKDTLHTVFEFYDSSSLNTDFEFLYNKLENHQQTILKLYNNKNLLVADLIFIREFLNLTPSVKKSFKLIHRINSFAIFLPNDEQLKAKLKTFTDILIESVNKQEEQYREKGDDSTAQVVIATNLTTLAEIVDDAENILYAVFEFNSQLSPKTDENYKCLYNKLENHQQTILKFFINKNLLIAYLTFIREFLNSVPDIKKSLTDKFKQYNTNATHLIKWIVDGKKDLEVVIGMYSGKDEKFAELSRDVETVGAEFFENLVSSSTSHQKRQLIYKVTPESKPVEEQTSFESSRIASAVQSILNLIKDHRNGNPMKKKYITSHVKKEVAVTLQNWANNLLEPAEKLDGDKHIARNKLLLLEHVFLAIKENKSEYFIRKNNIYALSLIFIPRSDSVSGTKQAHLKILKNLYLDALKEFIQHKNLTDDDLEFLKYCKESKLLAFHRSYYQFFCKGQTHSSYVANTLIDKAVARNSNNNQVRSNPG